MSPEAPVPIVEVTQEETMAGGAANVAANIAAFGAKVSLAGVVGNDYAGERLGSLLGEHGVDASLVVDRNRRTTVKTRIFGQGKQIIRFDEEEKIGIRAESRDAIIAYIREELEQSDVVLVSDYAKGVVSPELMREILALCEAQKKKIIVDPKPKNKELYVGVALITPNHHEAKAMFDPAASETDDTDLYGSHLLESLKCAVLVTRGAAGMSLYETGCAAKHMAAIAKEVFDVTGAGDTVVATAALALAAGASAEDASMLANHAAGVAVGKSGTATVSLAELKASINR
jgi:D-glycero-beta-D-manno-heptose-7-phosphate kinase